MKILGGDFRAKAQGMFLKINERLLVLKQDQFAYEESIRIDLQ